MALRCAGCDLRARRSPAAAPAGRSGIRLIGLALDDKHGHGDRIELVEAVRTRSPDAVRPGGWSGKARQSTPTAPVSADMRQATRAPDERPPQMSGRPRNDSIRSRSIAAHHAASSCLAGAGERLPATRYGCSTSATEIASASATSRAATRSRAVTPPPAPWPSTSAARAPSEPYTCARAAPDGVSISSTWAGTAAPGSAVTPRRRGPSATRPCGRASPPGSRPAPEANRRRRAWDARGRGPARPRCRIAWRGRRRAT